MKDLLPFLSELPLRVVLTGPAFMLLFLGIIAWVYRRSGRGTYQKVSEFPLHDDSRFYE